MISIRYERPIFTLALLAMVMFASSALAAPVLNPGNGHYYEIITGSSWNWAEARTHAQSQSYNGFQGHLVAITSQQENDFLRDDMAVPRNSWIGASQRSGSVQPAGGWSWVTGETWGFTSWGAGEPNNAGGNEACGHWWTPDGVWNDIKCTNRYGSYVIEYEDASSLTTFAVTKEFSDGSTDSVDVTLTCTTGLPLEQTFSIAGGDPVGVTFVVTDIQGPATCTVTESGGPSGYTPDMNDGAGCSWDNVFSGGYSCEITNEANPGTFTAWKEWIIVNDGGDAVNENVMVTITCDSPISGVAGSGPHWSLSGLVGDGGHLTATVDTTAGTASCWATESISASGVESIDDCGPRPITAGGSSSCTFTNTVFFEGIPTLSQYGLALMALLMLGVGMVGFRRFA